MAEAGVKAKDEANRSHTITYDAPKSFKQGGFILFFPVVPLSRTMIKNHNRQGNGS
jgi:hypothetical protein